MGEFRRPPEERSSAAGLLLTDATLAKVPLTVLSLARSTDRKLDHENPYDFARLPDCRCNPDDAFGSRRTLWMAKVVEHACGGNIDSSPLHLHAWQLWHHAAWDSWPSVEPFDEFTCCDQEFDREFEATTSCGAA